MDNFVEGTQLDSNNKNYPLPSGHPAVVFKSKADRVEYGVLLRAGRGSKLGYARCGDGIYDWWLQIIFWRKGKEREWYVRVSQGYFDDYWEFRDKNTQDSLRREEKMAELFNNIVKDIQAGKETEKIIEEYGLEFGGSSRDIFELGKLL